MGRLACKVVELVLEEYEKQGIQQWELDESVLEEGFEQ